MSQDLIDDIDEPLCAMAAAIGPTAPATGLEMGWRLSEPGKKTSAKSYTSGQWA
jgi:hypothetical protein